MRGNKEKVPSRDLSYGNEFFVVQTLVRDFGTRHWKALTLHFKLARTTKYVRTPGTHMTQFVLQSLNFPTLARLLISCVEMAIIFPRKI